MRLIEKYIYAVGQKLPYKNKEDIKKELRSLLYDEIEAKYGKNPTEDEIKQAISDFGSPRKVAKEYAEESLVIGSGLTELYFIIMKIMVFAISIASVITFAVELFKQDFQGLDVLKEVIIDVPFNIFSASLSGIGFLTILFIISTRLAKESSVNLDEDWTVDDLRNIRIEPAIESKLESIISIFFLTTFIVVINIYPQFLTNTENVFSTLSHSAVNSINVEVFKPYGYAISIIWLFEIIYHVNLLRLGVKTLRLKLMNLILVALSVNVFSLMVANQSLFTGEGYIGFKSVFLIILAVSLAEVIVKFAKLIFDLVRNKR